MGNKASTSSLSDDDLSFLVRNTSKGVLEIQVSEKLLVVRWLQNLYVGRKITYNDDKNTNS